VRQRGASETDDGREDHPFGVKHIEDSKIERFTQNMVIQGGDAPKEHRDRGCEGRFAGTSYPEACEARGVVTNPGKGDQTVTVESRA
jgi:hypothetical protein